MNQWDKDQQLYPYFIVCFTLHTASAFWVGDVERDKLTINYSSQFCGFNIILPSNGEWETNLMEILSSLGVKIEVLEGTEPEATEVKLSLLALCHCSSRIV